MPELQKALFTNSSGPNSQIFKVRIKTDWHYSFVPLFVRNDHRKQAFRVKCGCWYENFKQRFPAGKCKVLLRDWEKYASPG